MRFITLGSLAGLLSLAGSASANIVTNGGFETGSFQGWSLVGAPNQYFDVGGSFAAHSGSYGMFFADLQSANNAFYQTVPTSAGQTYELAFWVKDLTNGQDTLHIDFEGQSVFNLSPVNQPELQWTPYLLQVTATQNGSELRISGYDAPGAIYVDDLSLTAVPEPATLTLAAIFPALILRRRLTVA